jgi:hypothetical protein
MRVRTVALKRSKKASKVVRNAATQRFGKRGVAL